MWLQEISDQIGGEVLAVLEWHLSKIRRIYLMKKQTSGLIWKTEEGEKTTQHAEYEEQVNLEYWTDDQYE